MRKKNENMLDRSVEEILNPLHTRDEKREIIEYFRNLQNRENQAVEMVAQQQVTCNCHNAVVAGGQQQNPHPVAGDVSQEGTPQYVIVPGIGWQDLEPFKTLAKLSITDWLLVVIAILLFINIIRKK